MTEDRAKYKTPFEDRYASKEMLHIFSDNYKFGTWRKLWLALAEEEQRLGLNITNEQIKALRDNLDNIDFEYAKQKESELRHDVMAHVHTYAEAAPEASAIIHLGATSAYVGDNTDLIQIKDGLSLICKKLYNVIIALSERAISSKDITTLAFTHFQAAQPTTVGKRLCLYIQDFIDSFYMLENIKDNMRFLGVKGTTGTQASFLTLFHGDTNKVKDLDQSLAKKFNFDKVYAVSGQTYPRRFDSEVSMALSLLAISMHKMATDFRLLAHLREIDEPFEKSQIGSSAMAYKKNPMRSERICSICRYITNTAHTLENTASTQWFERTLDDSAAKRLAIPQIFLGIDSVLEILLNVSKGFVINERVIEQNLSKELPFMMTESIMMYLVEKGGDRQDIHEVIRVLSHKVMREIREDGLDNRLYAYLVEHKDISITMDKINTIIEKESISGMASVQVSDFVNDIVVPLKDKFNSYLSNEGGNLSV